MAVHTISPGRVSKRVMLPLCYAPSSIGSYDLEPKKPIKNFCVKFDFTLKFTREAKIGHVTDLIGQFQPRVKFYAGIFFIGSGPR